MSFIETYNQQAGPFQWTYAGNPRWKMIAR